MNQSTNWSTNWSAQLFGNSANSLNADADDAVIEDTVTTAPGVQPGPSRARDARFLRLARDPLFGNAPTRPYVATPSRAAALAALADAIRGAADGGRPCLAGLRGPAHAGKTRLARRAAEEARAGGTALEVLASTRTAADAATTYFPFRGVARAALRACEAATRRGDGADGADGDGDAGKDDGAVVRRLVRRKVLNQSDRLMIGRILPAVADDQLLSLLRGRSPTALTTDVAATLFKLLIPLQPVMLLLEAAGEGGGAVDPGSWELVEELLRSAGGRCPQMLVVVESRGPLRDAPPGVTAAPGRFVDVRVDRMDRADTEAHVRALFCNPGNVDRNMRVDPDVVDGVHGRAGGCPLFTERIVLWSQGREMIELDETRNAVASNLLHGGSSSSLLDALPANLNEEILEVINGLPHHLLDALKVAASLGVSFNVNDYGTMRDDEGLHDCLREVTASHRVFNEGPGGRYRWRHVAVHEAVDSIVISNERMEIHNRIADSLSRAGGDLDGGADRARYFVLAERWDEAFDRYMEAGGEAEGKLDFVGAVGLYRRAEACLARSIARSGGEPSLRRKLSPHTALGWCLRELVRYDEAETELEYCLEQTMAVPEGERDSQFEEIELDVVTTLATLKQAQSKYSEAAAMFERALPIARANGEGHSRAWLAHHVASCAEIHRKSGDLDRAAALHAEALGLRERAVEESSCTTLELALSFTQLGLTLSGIGDPAGAYGLHRRALAARVEHLDFYHGLVSESLNHCADALQALRRGREGIPLAMHAVRIRKFVFGPNHPAYAHSLGVLASCYHSVGRSFDSLGLLRECLEICEGALSEDHVSMIPNLALYGSVLVGTGEDERAMDVYERALDIHHANFEEGQNAQQLVGLEDAVRELELSGGAGPPARSSLEMPIPSFEPDGSRTHVIVCADIGGRASDEYMLSVAASLQKIGTLKLISVIAVSPPKVVRADIARGALDSLQLSNVPVAYSGLVSGPPQAAGAATFNADYGRPSAHVNNTGVELITRALRQAPEKSLVIMGTACLGDVSAVIDAHRGLFASKVKQVVLIGSVKHVRRRSFIEPEDRGGGQDNAHAENVYTSCQDLEIPTVTLFKDTCRGFPFPSANVDDLTASNHMVATKIQRSEEMQTNGIWELIKQLKRETSNSYHSLKSLDIKSFYKYSLGGKRPNAELHNIWPSIKSINLELVLGLLSCVPIYRDSHFRWETHQVKGVDHRVCRHPDATSGFIKPEVLSHEIHMLIGFALRTSLLNTSC